MTSPAERRAHVVGLGLIGASVARALAGLGWSVTGDDADPATRAAALAQGVVAPGGFDDGVELAVVATPASSVSGVAGDLLARSARASLVVTDVAGVKASIVAEVTDPRFLGGHPMAGSERRGLAGARADLFTGCTWVLTPTPATSPATYSALHGVLRELGANVVAVGAEDHDRLVALASHVPHLVAGALMNEAARAAEYDAVLLQLAAGGFRDMTRVAAGDPGIWPDVLVENREAVGAALAGLASRLADLRARDRDGRPRRAGRGAALGQRRAPAPARSRPARGRARLPARRGVGPAGPARPGHDRGQRAHREHLRHRDRPRHRGRRRHAAAGGRREPRRRVPRRAGVPGVLRGARASDPRPRARGATARPGRASPGTRARRTARSCWPRSPAGESRVEGLSAGEDVAATAAALVAMGARVERRAHAVVVHGPARGLRPSAEAARVRQLGHLDAAAGRGLRRRPRATHTLVGDASLSRRPMDRVATPLELMGARRAGPRAAAPRAAARHGLGAAARDRLHRAGGQRAGEVGGPARRARRDRPRRWCERRRARAPRPR